MSILVTGGAGYIGSHMVLALLDRGEHVVVLDNLSTGIRERVPAPAKLVVGDAGDSATLGALFQHDDIDAVIHFAGSIVVPESVAKPLEYYRNNSAATRNLIAACVENGIRQFIFSSTAAVYGIPADVPVCETAPTNPINPYGRSKLMSEWILADTARAHDFRYAALRYFNVAGADPKGRSGQSTPRATHLIKRACQVAIGREERLEIFGTDFPTADGTGVRDYIHVSDLIDAHLLALDRLRADGVSLCANAGYGRGFSVLEVIAAVERAAGHKLNVRRSAPRPGDPPTLVADPGYLKSLGWQPKCDDLDTIVKSALAWERTLQLAGSR
ncbi:MAG TPA: UDP-glucose 4-epimerase GalE [Rhizomicrobium sp.]